MRELTSKEWRHYHHRPVLCNHRVFDIIDYGEHHITLSLDNGYHVNPDTCNPVLRDINDTTAEDLAEFVRLFSKEGETFLEGFRLEGDIIKYKFNDGPNGGSWQIATISMLDWFTDKGFAIRQEFERGVAVKEGNNEKS